MYEYVQVHSTGASSQFIYFPAQCGETFAVLEDATMSIQVPGIRTSTFFLSCVRIIIVYSSTYRCTGTSSHFLYFPVGILFINHKYNPKTQSCPLSAILDKPCSQLYLSFCFSSV